MKPGDKLLCKRSMANCNNKKFFFIRNKFYEITDCREYTNGNIYISVKNERGYPSDFALSTPHRKLRLHRNFYTEQELRKFKIKKLNELR